MRWQPIETAPKDGTVLWLVEDGAPLGATIPHQCMGYWLPDKRYAVGGYWQHAFNYSAIAATHWMPLPEPPR